MKSWFANISVTKKLALGFGVVLALTVMLAWNGWNSLGSVIQRSLWMTEITHLNTTWTNVRIARLQFMVDNADQVSTDRLKTNLGIYIDQQKKLLATFKNPVNVEMLKQQAAINEDYQRSLQVMFDAYALANGARQEVAAQSEKAKQAIAGITAATLRLPAENDNRFARLLATTEIKEDLLQLDYLMAAYRASANPQTEQALLQSVDDMVASVPQLASAMSGDERMLVQQIEGAVNAYKAAVGNYTKANKTIARSRQEMTLQGYEINKISDALYKFQVDRLGIESGEARNVQLISALLAVLFGVLAAWLITQQIIRPLRETMTHVERIASGDLTSSAQITRRDEMGVLQQGIQRMGSTLRELISGIRDGVSQISSAAEELSAVTEQTSAGVNSQKVETDQVATAMHEMSATVQEVARNAEEAAQAAVEADNEAREGDRVVAEVVAQIERLASEVGRSTEAMKVLEKESNKIGSVMDVIKAVAEQTNLLALNAAIEAARAGEAGRGFAVVADEVRGLAQRTQKSTEEIEELVAGLQSGTQQVATVMQSSRNLTDSSVELTRRAGGSLSNITRTVSNIQSMNQQIAAAAEQQSAVAEEISRSILNVRDVSEQTAAASQETASSSVELARLGNQLQMLVSRFRV
ncbi:methyl-accepting chemotaxis protein [Stutzerimonas azotifigens]|uniref:HAMP domain-containing protein n=1 Tax=Stutzerimonas azotifigens TaxID=291995 RepID=A0ABR5Z681_9GAMM|nr:methyl-accepting chemotaxis protein [Stutzerimonas azotifigens]MBA1275674.1 HAMP domain-containing protein [Stutzerimonas azotifigens]